MSEFSKGILVGFVIGTLWMLCLLGVLMIITGTTCSHPPYTHTESLCIERQCPNNPYDRMSGPSCMAVDCTLSEDAVINNWSFSVYGRGYIPNGCYENYTGQDPNDLVIHLTCPEGVQP
ncbi:MAG: hypothetical protein M0Q91_16300 [Methanoregula sp.]|jgi:hypothetical protein|nr:hypothetical protein [Methanoregula sp.]